MQGWKCAGRVEGVATLLYNATLCAGVRWLHIRECAAVAHIRNASGLETLPQDSCRLSVVSNQQSAVRNRQRSTISKLVVLLETDLNLVCVRSGCRKEARFQTSPAKTQKMNDSAMAQGHLVVHIYFISVDTFYEIGLDFHAISRKNVNIRKLKSKAEPKTK